MWSLFSCYVSGWHEFGVSREPGAIFLRCVHCGRRSSGWAIDVKALAAASPRGEMTVIAAKPLPRVIPFGRVAIR